MVFLHELQSQGIRCCWPFTGQALWGSVAKACQAQLSGLTTPVCSLTSQQLSSRRFWLVRGASL